MQRNDQKNNGQQNFTFRDIKDSRVVIMIDKHSVALSDVNDYEKKGFKGVLLVFVDNKLAELQRSEEWLRAIVVKELEMRYDTLQSVDITELFEICKLLDEFHLQE
ncbi:MAG: hypothetical protein AB7F25_12240 [Deferribacterales bacterium]